MKVKLELEFGDLTELKTFLDSKVEKTCSCQTLAPSMPVSGAVVSGTGTVEVLDAQAESVTVFPPQEEAIVASTTESVESAPITAEPPTQDTVTPTVESSPAVPTAANSYTLDDLARAGSELVDLGKQAELPGLLQRFNITSLPELPQEKYGEFATAMRELGARI